MRLLLIKTAPDAHLYNHFIWALHEALIECGHDALIFDQFIHIVNDVGPREPLAEALRSLRPDAVISLNSFMGDMELVTGESFYDTLGIKFVGWQLDHPIYTPASLGRDLQGRYGLYASHNHLRYVQTIKLPGRGMTLMPGGREPSAPIKDYSAREWPIFIAATWNGQPQRNWERAEDSPGKRLMTGVVEALLRDPNASLIDALGVTSAKLKLGVRLGDNPAFDETLHAFLRDPLSYVRYIDRINIIRALVEAGLPVTICGPGWESFLGERKNVAYVGPVAFDDLQALYGNARVVLNLNAGNGGSERAVYAALAGAAIASDYGDQVDGLLKRGCGVAFFNRAKPETAAKVVGDLIESDRGEAMAQQGRERVLASGLWRHRAAQLIDFISS